MLQRRFTTKLVAVFIVAFVCLNAGGALCVAYCLSPFESDHGSTVSHAEEMSSGHCDPKNQPEDGTAFARFGIGEIDCCPMTVSFFAAPVEKNQYSVKAPAMALVAVADFTSPLAFGHKRSTSPKAYRGPPLDQRSARLMHGVIRI